MVGLQKLQIQGMLVGELSRVRFFLICGAAKGANPDPRKLQIYSGEVCFFLKSLESSEMC